MLDRWGRNAATAILVLLIAGYIAVSLWTQTRVNRRLPSDIAIYLEAGDRAVTRMNPYQPFAIGTSFVYPPTALLLFGPLSLLADAELTWAATNVVALLGVVLVTWRMTKLPMKRQTLLWLILLALLFAPFLEALTIGQVNAVVLLCVALFTAGMIDRRFRWLGDFSLAIAIAIKMTPAILLAWPLIMKDWARCARVLLSLLLLTALSALFYGLDPWRAFVDVLPELFQGYPDVINQALTPTLEWLAKAVSSPANVSWLGPLFTVATLSIWIVLLLFYGSTGDPLSIVALGIATMTVGSSLIWYHHLVFLLIPVFLLLFAADWRKEGKTLISVAVLIAFGLIHSDRWFEITFQIPPFASIIGYLLIYIASVGNLVRRSLPGNKIQTSRIDSADASADS